MTFVNENDDGDHRPERVMDEETSSGDTKAIPRQHFNLAHICTAAKIPRIAHQNVAGRGDSDLHPPIWQCPIIALKPLISGDMFWAARK